LPGGISSRGEAEESAVCREVHEETGLEVSSINLAMRYHSSADVPCNISVFLVKASGELRHSWEGQPQWMTVEELEPHLLESQRPTLELMKKLAAGLPLE
jgi:ADP-ribose pyrophosphatase YjhB (NUDIX family)